MSIRLSPRVPVRKAMGFWQEFRQFAFQGNLVDLAVGLVIGTSFKQLTTSFVDNILMPPIGLLLGNADFSQLFLNLSKQHYATLSAAEEAGAPVIRYGQFLTNLIDFFLVALSLYIVLRFFLGQKKEAQESSKK